jgi:hypothetical protein
MVKLSKKANDDNKKEWREYLVSSSISMCFHLLWPLAFLYLVINT